MPITDQAVTTRVEEVIAARSNGALLAAKQPHADTLQFAIDKRAVPAVVDALVNQLQARYLISVGTHRRPLTGDFGISHLFSLDRDHLYRSARILGRRGGPPHWINHPHRSWCQLGGA